MANKLDIKIPNLKEAPIKPPSTKGRIPYRPGEEKLNVTGSEGIWEPGEIPNATGRSHPAVSAPYSAARAVRRELD